MLLPGFERRLSVTSQKDSIHRQIPFRVFFFFVFIGMVSVNSFYFQPRYHHPSEASDKVQITDLHSPLVVMWSADGTQLAIGGWNGSNFLVQIWDVDAKEFVGTFEGTDFEPAISWHPQDNLLAYSREYTELYIEDTQRGTDVSVLEVEYVTAIDWNSDGQLLATANGEPLSRVITVWDSQSGEAILTLEDDLKGVGSVAWSPDDTMIAGKNWDASLSIWEAQTGTLLTTLDGGGYYGSTFNFSPNQAAAWSPDSSRIAVYANTNLFESYVVWVWDVANEELIATLDDHEALITAVAWSPDGSLIATGSDDTTIRIWDAETYELSAVLEDDHTDFINSVAWSPDGTQLASASKDGTVVIQDITVEN